MIKTLSLTLACAVALATGCADESSAPMGPSDTNNETDGGLDTDQDPVTNDEEYEQPAPWAELSTEQRFEFMKKAVMPAMTAVFQKADPNAKVSCGTCHGENAGEVGFKMPNGLAPLNVADFPLDKSADEDIAAAAVFMQTEVVPAMAALLEVDIRSAEKPDGFGCFGCHARAE